MPDTALPEDRPPQVKEGDRTRLTCGYRSTNPYEARTGVEPSDTGRYAISPWGSSREMVGFDKVSLRDAGVGTERCVQQILSVGKTHWVSTPNVGLEPSSMTTVNKYKRT